MKQESPAADSQPSAAQSADQTLLADLREANEKLLLATLRAQELSDLAQAAQRSAELANEKLRESERELLATAEFRERLLGIVGHDLRNPLGAISICAQLLLTEGHGDRDSVVTLVAFLLKSVRRMDRMIKQIFEFTQARLGGGIPLQLSPTSMRPICQHAIEELVLISTVPIKAEYQGDISGNWDDERLMEALSNLIGNAIDHATPGTPVMVRAIRQGSDVTVEVANQGLPIPAELLPVLFVPFHRGRPGINARAGHLGLGLYIAHEITRLHGGTLTVQTSGGTTSLLMRLPRQPPPTDG